MMKISKKSRYIFSFFGLISIIVLLSQNILGQVSSDVIIADENNCEQNLSYFDILVREANTYPGSMLILIARLGKGEESRKHNQRRLKVIENGLSAFNRYPAERIILTEGERVQEKGQVEIYIAGRLVAVFKAARRRNFNDPYSKKCEV